jgi:hypothetical protein
MLRSAYAIALLAALVLAVPPASAQGDEQVTARPIVLADIPPPVREPAPAPQPAEPPQPEQPIPTDTQPQPPAPGVSIVLIVAIATAIAAALGFGAWQSRKNP